MKIIPLDKIICRTPAFGINQTIEEVWEELKLKIEESSPGFHSVIKTLKTSELNQLDEKAKYTIWKYFNRAKFRSTPFGSFAAILNVKLSFAETKNLVITKDMFQHHWINWDQKENYLNNNVSNINYICSNSSIYLVEDEIRYLKTSADTFELAAVTALPELNTILLNCKIKTSLGSIYELMKNVFNMDKRSTKHLLQQLVDLQLLHTDLQANITGEDYFTKLQIAYPKQARNYIIAERALLQGHFDGKLLKSLPEMIAFFTKCFKVPQNTDLSNFKSEFVKRFEHKEMSLAQLMDPEIGIGYGNLAQLSGTDILVDEIKNLKGNILEKQINYGKLQQFLLKKMLANVTIDLNEFEVEEKGNSMLPNTFSLIFHLYHGKPVLAHTGGSTANALLGRFTIVNQEFENDARAIADLEMNANSNVLFFDIAYQAENKVDNVNRRKQLYPYELPILTWSDTNNPLDLNDILVAVEQNEVILKSKSLGKRLIPRIPSAYNYTRSDLAVYRFLCDIQCQGLLTSFNFKLQDFFPGLVYYPRVNFKEIIISPAMWLLPSSALNDITSISNWLAAQHIDKIFKVGYADQSLSFDPKKKEDLWALLNYSKQQDEIYITEALLAEVDYIKDEENNLYSPQYIVNYYHQDRVYNPSSPKPNEPVQFYLPGSEWLYFEIYCHPAKSNSILLGLIRNYLNINKIHLKKWFYIRYTDPKPHIRLRLHLKNTNLGFILIQALQKLVEPEMQKGLITDFKLQTYHKENQRYGSKKIDLIEQFFKEDSIYALFLVKHSTSDYQLMINATHVVKELCELCFETLEEQISFVKKMAKSFAEEMNLEATSFKKINTNFNQLKGNLAKEIIQRPIGINKKWKNLFSKLMVSCEDQAVKQTLLADLIHMHINRLFLADQRIYETIIYHYLIRILHTKLAISTV
ncbi:lantibiotic dehydratase [Pedobacter polaris]|nr:lantibiotic dehydratase [Pedobacter polaris]